MPSEEKILRKFLREVRTGLYGVLIMHLLSKHGQLHGYGIRQQVIRVSGGVLTPSESTVYETLRNLSKLGLVESFWSITDRAARKYYRLTDLGVRVYGRVRAEVVTLAKFMLSALEGGQNG